MENNYKDGKEEGLILGELKAVRTSIDDLKTSFSEFRHGIGERMECCEECVNNHNTAIELMKDRVEDLSDTKKKVIWFILASVGTALLALIFRK